jgi:ABC-type dipeptide/oligopeptide/nickel transport system permease component
MRTYALRRLVLFVPTLLGASLLIFVLRRLLLGDTAEILVYQTGTESSAVQQKQIQHDRPFLAQFVTSGASRGRATGQASPWAGSRGYTTTTRS